MTILTQNQSVVTQKAEALQAGIFAMALGAMIIGIVGFASPQAIHDAAHDVRHANIAPCH